VKLSRMVRTGNPIGPGWSGLVPPAEMLRTYETVPDGASLPAASLRAEGARAYQSDASRAWDRLAGAWRDLSTFGALYQATGGLNTLMGLVQVAGFPGNLIAVATGYNAGWRPGNVVHNAAFNAASVTVNGLSAAKRYRILWQLDASGYNDGILLQPDGSGVAYSYQQGANNVLSPQANLGVDYMLAAETPHVIVMVIEPRTGGLSQVHAAMGSAAAAGVNARVHTTGGTSTDFTSLTFNMGHARTGWLTVIEEAP
jgi:hypothetical protein